MPVKFNDVKPAWGLLLSVWLVVFFLFAMLQAVSPVLPFIIEDLNINFLLGGILFSFPLATIVLLSYPLGLISDKIGADKAIVWGMVMAIAFGFLRGISNNFFLLLFFTILYGTGLTFCFVSLPQFVKKYFPAFLIATATGVYSSAIPTGAGTGISITMPLARTLNLNWQGVFKAWSLMGTAALILLILLLFLNRTKTHHATRIINTVKEPDFQKETVLLKQQVPDGLRGNNLRIVFMAGVLFFLLNLFFYCITGWLPTYLTEKGWEPEIAALAASIVPFTEIPTILILPVFSRNRMKTFMISGFLGIAVSIFIIIIFPAITWTACALLGISLGAVFPLLLSLPARIPNIGNDIGRASGILLSVGYLGPLAGVPLLGFFRDAYGEFMLGFVILILLSILAAILSLRLPDLDRSGLGV